MAQGIINGNAGGQAAARRAVGAPASDPPPMNLTSTRALAMLSSPGVARTGFTTDDERARRAGAAATIIGGAGADNRFDTYSAAKLG